MTATHANTPMTSMMHVKPVAPAADPVVLRKTWTCCAPRGVSRTDIVSPTQKQKVIAIIQPIKPLPSHVHIIARGTTCAALRTSSDMCAPASTPTKQLAAPVRPTIVDNETLPHPILSWNKVNTSPVLLRSPITHRGMITAKKPAMWSTTMTPSMSGSFLEKKVLKRRQTAKTAQMSRVPCQAFGSYVGFQRMMRA